MFPIPGPRTLFLELFIVNILLSLAFSLPSTELSPITSFEDTTATLATDPPSINDYIPPTTYTGDVLNLTKCYCEEEQDSRAPTQDYFWGHYYKADYYNFHLGKLYSLTWTCHSKDKNRRRADLPKCWDEKGTSKARKVFPDGNLFSYVQGFNGMAPLWGNGKTDNYFFNDQKRALPKPGPGTLEFVPDSCEGYCRDQVQGMVAARDRDALPGMWVKEWQGPGLKKEIKSFFRSYTDLDDMCDGCK